MKNHESLRGCDDGRDDFGCSLGSHPIHRGIVLGWSVVICCLAAELLAGFPENSATRLSGVDQEFGPTPGLSQQEILQGWLSLFDGETLFGWKAVTDANWHVEQGEIRVAAGTSGLLRTTTQFDDFELILDFKSDEKTNSGIFLRTSPRPQNPLTDCYELNIATRVDHSFPTGSLVGRAATELDFPTGLWQQVRVIVDGPDIHVWINGTKTLEYVDPKPLGRGYLGLQFNSGSVAFRNIRLRPLNVPEIELDAGLKNWNLEKKLNSEFSVTQDRELEIRGGRGQIETRQQFGDFIFSVLCRTNSDALNSGIFFRCLPGELMNGYESQIQNQFKNQDRTQPVDCGTGGIFRRADARRVNADDKRWFAKTIIAVGPHFAVWVNGYQVTDWSDRRKPHVNPRNGLRLERGSIIFQGHDPTTDVLMKEIKVREISPRGK